MADDVELNPMSGGPAVATDDSGTGHVQIVKLAHSADGSRTHLDADANGLKVNLSNASVPVTDNGGSLTVDGTVAATQSGSWTVTANAGTGIYTVIERGATIGHGQASVTTSAAQVLASSTTRRTVALTNLGTDYVWIGATGITANNGMRLSPGQTLVIDRAPNAAVFAIASSGTQAVAYFTESD